MNVYAQKAREEGAELLPLVEMAQRGFLGCLAPRNFEAIDSFIFSPDIALEGSVPKVARIQSKYTKGATFVPLKKLNFDFLVVVRDIFTKKKRELRHERTVFVVPVATVRSIWHSNRVVLSDIPWSCKVGSNDFEHYQDPWNAISLFLTKKGPA